MKRYCAVAYWTVASPGSGVEGAQKYMKLFVAHKMMRNTLNKVHIAATELPQLLSQNTNVFGETTAQSRCQTLCSSKVN